MSKQPEWMTVSEVARFTDVTPSSVRVWANLGSLPTTRTASGVRLFKKNDVERFHLRRQAARSERLEGRGA